WPSAPDWVQSPYEMIPSTIFIELRRYFALLNLRSSVSLGRGSCAIGGGLGTIVVSTGRDQKSVPESLSNTSVPYPNSTSKFGASGKIHIIEVQNDKSRAAQQARTGVRSRPAV